VLAPYYIETERIFQCLALNAKPFSFFVLQAANQAEAFNLVHPHDRNGKPIADRHCTREVEEALNDYRAACDTARAAVRGQLRLLAETLQVDPSPIPCAHKSF